MKRIYTISLLVLTFSFLFVSISKAQVIYSENFEALNTGEGISQQVPAHWTTWDNTPGTSQDPLVSEAYANDGTKSLVIDATLNDVVMTVDYSTANRYKMDFYIYIPSNRCAFYSPMQEFDVTNSVFTNGCQVFFNDGEGTVDASGSEGIATFTYNSDEWLHIKNYFDLDNDIIELYINDQLIHIGAWSPGISTTQNSIQGFDFYGWDGSTPEFYIDDIVYEQIESVNPAQNLSLAIVNQFDIQLNWEAPVSGTPESYKIYRNGLEVATITGELSYLDEHMFPATYEYFVLAYYGESLGNSAPTNTASIEIEGGVARQNALLEIYTGTECTDANWLVYSTNLLASTDLNYILLNFVQDVDFIADGTNERLNLYTNYFDEDEDNALLCPTSIVDGMFGYEGYIGSMADQKAYYVEQMTKTLAVPSLYTINPTVEIVGTAPYQFDISVDVEELLPYYDDDIAVTVILSESNVTYSWQSFSELNNLVREIQSQTIDFTSGVTQTMDFNLTLDESYDDQNSALTIFVQNLGNGQIMQAISMPLTDVVGIEDVKIQTSSIYPNPASNLLFVSGSEIINHVDFINVTGQIVKSIDTQSQELNIDLSNFAKGIYFVRVYSKNDVELHKLIIE